MDGNRRYAKQRGLSAMDGHRAGYERMKQMGEWCLARGVNTVTVFAFSTENWKRAPQEVSFLLGLMEWALREELAYFVDRKIRLRIIGRREGFSKPLVSLIERAEAMTHEFTDRNFVICLNYGGRAEIVDAVKSMVKAGVSVDEVTEELLAKHLYWADMPDPDLIVRTSGEERLSGFLLWQSAYSELYWSQKMWPEFDEAELDLAIGEYEKRQRRFGA